VCKHIIPLSFVAIQQKFNNPRIFETAITGLSVSIKRVDIILLYRFQLHYTPLRGNLLHYTVWHFQKQKKTEYKNTYMYIGKIM